MIQEHQGFWLKIALPPALAGETLTLSRNVSQGFWAPASSFSEQDGVLSGDLPAAEHYSPQETRVWQAWLPADTQAPGAPFALSVDYPDSVLKSPSSADFIFYKPKAQEGGNSLEPVEQAAARQTLRRVIKLTVPGG